MTSVGSQPSSGYRQIVLVAWIMQGLIVVSGAAVRLTQAGLGCEDWPTCNEDELLPEWELHGLIEFGNRVISGLVAVSAVAALVGAYRLATGDGAGDDGNGRRSDVLRYAWALVAGTLAQVVLGGITVLADLHPIVVSVHFLLSMVLLWNAQLLWLSVTRKHPSAPLRSVRDRAIGGLATAQLVLAGLVLLTGTVVTGTGPNSGDSRADRLDFDLTTVARVHSSTVWLLVAAAVVLFLRLARAPADGPDQEQVGRALITNRWLLLALVAQGAIGYTQFALGVPAGLVEAHVLGSVVVWTISSRLHLRLRRWETAPSVPQEPPLAATAE